MPVSGYLLQLAHLHCDRPIGCNLHAYHVKSSGADSLDPAGSNSSRGASARGHRADLVTFLRSLTDERFLRDPRFSGPQRSSLSRLRD